MDILCILHYNHVNQWSTLYDTSSFRLHNIQIQPDTYILQKSKDQTHTILYLLYLSSLSTYWQLEDVQRYIIYHQRNNKRIERGKRTESRRGRLDQTQSRKNKWRTTHFEHPKREAQSLFSLKSAEGFNEEHKGERERERGRSDRRGEKVRQSSKERKGKEDWRKPLPWPWIYRPKMAIAPPFLPLNNPQNPSVPLPSDKIELKNLNSYLLHRERE